MLYSAQHNAILYETDAPLPILAATEGGRKINGSMVAIPATLGNLQALSAQGRPVIPVMERDGYDWPIRAPWAPLAHQKVTANFLVLRKRCFCLNDMGTMKTLSALWAADYLMEMERRDGRAFRAIVSAPLSILRSVWGDALFQNFMSRRSFVILHGSAEKRLKLLSQPADFYIINHDGLGVGVSSDRRTPFEGLARELAAREDIRLAIVDEASVYRDASTKRHRVARKLIGSREYLWLMTGTPTPNGPLDAYGLARLVNGAHGESFHAYKNRVMMPAGPFKWLPRVGSAEAASKLMSPAVRYAIEDCVNLPPCTVQKRDAEMSEMQHRAYKALKREAVLAMKSGALIQAVNQAALRIKLIQIACGAVYDAEHESHELYAEPRMALVEEIISEATAKIAIFVPLTNALNMLYKRLKDKWSCAVINGATPKSISTPGNVTEILRDFQDKKDPHIVICDPGSVAHGNDFTAADIEIWYAPTDKNEHYQQGVKRVDRPGQKRCTTIVQIAATDVEREIYLRLENNQSMQGVILKLAEEK